MLTRIAGKLGETGAVMVAFRILFELFADRVVDGAEVAGAEKAAGLRGLRPALQVPATSAFALGRWCAASE